MNYDSSLSSDDSSDSGSGRSRSRSPPPTPLERECARLRAENARLRRQLGEEALGTLG